MTSPETFQRLVALRDQFLADPDDQKIRRKLEQVRNQVLLENRGLVHTIASNASKYTKDANVMADLIQAGLLGIMKALERYDPTRAKFSTYATVWIKGEICKELRSLQSAGDTSLDQRLYTDGMPTTLHDTLESPNLSPSPRMQSDRLWIDQLNVLLERLEREHAQLLRLRFGWQTRAPEAATVLLRTPRGHSITRADQASLLKQI